MFVLLSALYWFGLPSFLLQAINLEGIDPMCLPGSAAADAAASQLAKFKRDFPDVKKPFPFMDLASFVPTWAEAVIPF